MSTRVSKSSWKVPLHFQLVLESTEMFRDGFLIEILTFVQPNYGDHAIRLELLVDSYQAYLLESFGFRAQKESNPPSFEFGPRRSLFRDDYVDRNLAPISEHFLYNYFRQGLYPFPNNQWKVLSSRGALSVDSINMAWEFAVNDELADLRNLVQHGSEF